MLVSNMGGLHFGFDAGEIDGGSGIELAAVESGIVVSERSCDPLHGHDRIMRGECPVRDQGVERVGEKLVVFSCHASIVPEEERKARTMGKNPEIFIQSTNSRMLQDSMI